MLKALFVPRYLSFCPGIFYHVGKRLDKNAEVDLIHNFHVTKWTTNNYNTLKKLIFEGIK